MLDFPLHFPGTNATLPWTKTEMSAAVVLVALTVVVIACCGAAALVMVTCCGGRRRDTVGESGDSRWLPGVGVIDYVPTSNRSSIRVSLVLSENTDEPSEGVNTLSTNLSDNAASNSSISLIIDAESNLSPPISSSVTTLPALFEEAEAQLPLMSIKSEVYVSGKNFKSTKAESKGHCESPVKSENENNKDSSTVPLCSYYENTSKTNEEPGSIKNESINLKDSPSANDQDEVPFISTSERSFNYNPVPQTPTKLNIDSLPVSSSEKLSEIPSHQETEIPSIAVEQNIGENPILTPPKELRIESQSIPEVKQISKTSQVDERDTSALKCELPVLLLFAST